MFSMGPGELLLIAVVVLVLVGPEKLPEFARTIARTIRDLKKYGQEVRKEFEQDLLTDDIKRDWEDITSDRPTNYSYTRPSDTYKEEVEPYESEEPPEDHSDESTGDTEGDEAADDEKEGSDSMGQPSDDNRPTD
jgi:sec-independent protein translocase protein TatB